MPSPLTIIPTKDLIARRKRLSVMLAKTEWLKGEDMKAIGRAELFLLRKMLREDITAIDAELAARDRMIRPLAAASSAPDRASI